MKRINRTLTAAVLAGSLALGGTAVASAQIPAPAELTVDGLTYQKQADGSYKSTNELGATTMTAEEAQFVWEQQQAQAADAEAPEEDAPTTTSVMAPDMDMAATGEATAPSSVDYPINGESEAEPTSAEFDKKQLAWLALPAALIIGGVTWYLAKDGKTYVKSEEAAQKDAPSAEEKAASEKMLQENKDEVIAQGGKVAEGTAAQTPAQSRGISAETGSNTVARGLAALAIAAMIAAGAIVARRKLFI
ncbi:hypothetical protein FKE98_09460 [Corynebacterium aurimucosum]|uniref:hypothetical protein n=1 Tax=Corynebacterium TaxID=1716 RepID=UPI0012B8CB61|nr:MULTISPECIES: hypothetical protein [Corynebacterium]MBE7339814.1 hypothetical protein [Corynebacterium aurimucosum]MTE10623.1 hypothetical protein [Corynebacterium guaraldiae]